MANSKRNNKNRKIGRKSRKSNNKMEGGVDTIPFKVESDFKTEMNRIELFDINDIYNSVFKINLKECNCLVYTINHLESPNIQDYYKRDRDQRNLTTTFYLLVQPQPQPKNYLSFNPKQSTITTLDYWKSVFAKIYTFKTVEGKDFEIIPSESFFINFDYTNYRYIVKMDILGMSIIWDNKTIHINNKTFKKNIELDFNKYYNDSVFINICLNVNTT